MSADETKLTGIAVIGMSGRFPGAASVEALWHNLREGICGTTFFSREELAAAGVSAAELADPRYVRAAGLLGGAELFDAELFGLSAPEAEVMDPQQRVFLECAWAALEDAGYDQERFPGWIGVYAGAGLGKYLWLNVAKSPQALAAVGAFQALITNDKDYLATQVSYRLNLRGPSLGVQTACSTSLVAVHLACQALLCFECDLALAGGVAISLPERQGYLYQDDGLSSPDGTCRPFDAQGVGTIRGNGAAVVVLKRLADALADGDRVLAVIKGSAINNDGAGKVGFTAPSVGGQAEVIAAAHAVAEVDPATIDYVEAHGTGTVLGDPVEVAALNQAFGVAAGGPGSCALGSVKSNVGHLDAAAGVTGLIKTVLALAHGELPPTLHYASPNPTIDFAGGPFYVSAERQPWPQREGPRRAGVSAFGIGGTNAHVVLEEAPQRLARDGASPVENRPWQLLTLAARSPGALEAMAARLAAHLDEHPDLDLADVAYTLQVGRRELPWRRTVPARNAAEASARLSRSADPSRPAEESPEIVFVLGAGAADGTGGRAGWGAELYRGEPVFRSTVEECCGLLDGLRPGRGAELRRSIAEPDGGSPAAHFVRQLALARVWTSWGAAPAMILGDGGGEHAAACLAGALPLPAALALAALAPGSPTLRDDIRRIVEGARLQAPTPTPTPAQAARIPYVSGLTGQRMEAGELTAAAHWMNVGTGLAGAADDGRLAAGLRILLSEPGRVLLEVGSAAGLGEIAREISPRARSVGGFRPPAASGGAGAPEQLLQALGQLWEHGLAVDWQRFHEGESRRRVSLPAYPFEHRRYWLEGPADDESAGAAARPAEEAASARRPLDEWFSLPSWRRTLAPRRLSDDPPDVRPGVCLVLADSCGLGEALGSALVAAGWRVILAFAGEAWEALGAGRFRLRPGDAADHARLWAELAAGAGLPRRVLHLWNVTAAAEAEPGGRALDPGDPDNPGDLKLLAAGLDRSFYSLLHLAQSLGRHPEVPTDLLVVANRLHAVDGGDRPEPVKAALLGICRVVPQELDHVRCRTVDVEIEAALPLDGAAGQRLVEACLAEAAAPDAEGAVAWRGPHRWTPSWEAVALPPTDAAGEGSAGPPRGLRRRGVYVVTGGLGGVGLEVAEALAESAQARLVLVGRSAFPEPELWDGWIEAHGAEDPLSRTIARLRSLEAKGAEILVAQADVSEREAVAALRWRVEARFGAVDGIFHAAGVAGGGLLQGRSAEQAAAVLAPKMFGTLVLSREFADASLLVLFSSLNALTGGIGQADYAAANAFLDSFSAAAGIRNGGARHVVSINWDAWQQAGMAARADVPEELRAWLERQLAEAIQPAEGREALLRILSAVGGELAPPAQIAVSTDPLRERLADAAALRLSTAIRESAAAAPRAQHPRPAVAPAYVPASTPLEAHLAGLWQQLLGIAPIGRDDGFFELGGHSLLAGQLTSRLRDELGIELPLQAIFTYPTPALLAAALAEIGIGPPGGGVPLQALPRASRRIVRSTGEVEDAADLALMAATTPTGDRS